MFNLKNFTGRDKGFIPALPLTIHTYWRKEGNGDKSLFPACNFPMFGELLDLGASQESQPIAKH